jgi:soluble lytic murein transglycosylase-like protein
MDKWTLFYQQVARTAAQNNNIDGDIFVAMITTESHWNPMAVSGAGAVGIAQIMPNFHPGVNPRDPIASLEYSAKLVRSYLDLFDDSYKLALAAYHMGSPTVMGFGGRVPEYEMRRYVGPILANADQLRADRQQQAIPVSVKATEVPATQTAIMATPTPVSPYQVSPTPTPPAICLTFFVIPLVWALLRR